MSKLLSEEMYSALADLIEAGNSRWDLVLEMHPVTFNQLRFEEQNSGVHLINDRKEPWRFKDVPIEETAAQKGWRYVSIEGVPF